jgi:hypothetical protein
MNRIRSVDGYPTDNILLHTDDQNWPSRSIQVQPSLLRRRGGFELQHRLPFASGPFILKAARRSASAWRWRMART